MSLRMLALLLFLLPSLATADAYEPTPLEVTVLASTCIPDEQALGLWKVFAHGVTLRQTRLSLPRPGSHLPVLVRCPLPGQGTGLWNRMQITAFDPDGAANTAFFLVELKRQILPTPPAPQVWPGVEVIGRLHSLFRPGGDPPQVLTYEAVIAETVVDFRRYTYWLELSLARQSLAVAAPRLYLVRLLWQAFPPD